MKMVQTAFLLVDVPNNRIDDKFVVLTEDVDKARDCVIANWADRLKPEIGILMFEITDTGRGIEYHPTERSRY